MTDIETSRRPGLGGIEPFPIPDPEDLICLKDTKLLRLEAKPSKVPPFGEPSTISWSVKPPPGCPTVALRLNGKLVSTSGSMTVEPTNTTTYTLTAGIRQASRVLGRTRVEVDTEECRTGSVPEELVRQRLRAAIEKVDEDTSRIRLRRPASVEIDSAGVKVAIRMKIDINNFPDPDLDVDFVLGLRLRDGEVEPYYRSFDVDVSWPRWIGGISLGITKLVEGVIEDKIERQLKPEVLRSAKEAIEELAGQLPGTHKIHRVVTARDRIDVTVCPAGDHVPHLVPGSSGSLDGDLVID